MAALLAAAPDFAAAQAAGEAPPATGTRHLARIYVGMWTAHIRKIHRGLDSNWLVGVTWRGFYGGTFINSYGDRSFAAGIQRTVARGRDGTLVPNFGYRVGLITGYDGRFIPLASKTPVLPLAQVLGGLDVGRTGLELGWAGLIASLSPAIRF